MRNPNSIYDRLFAHDRFSGQNFFTSNPNAELPNSDIQTVGYPIGDGVVYNGLANGKYWDDSEVSDEEMDRLMEQHKNLPLLFCEDEKPKKPKPKYNFLFG